MSIDSSEQVNSDSQSPQSAEASCEARQWELVRHRFLARAKHGDAAKMFAKAAKAGAVYRWGVAVANGGPCDQQTDLLSRLACDQHGGRTKQSSVDVVSASDLFVESMNRASSFSTLDAANVVLWSAALPALSDQLDPARWWRVLSAIQLTRESILQQSRCYAPTHLILGAELGLTLAWRLGELPSCQRLVASSVDAFTQWCNQDDESVQAAITAGTDARLVLASFIRSRLILDHADAQKRRKQQDQVGAALATWVAAMTTHTGGSAFSTADRKDVQDDLPPHGLLAHAVDLDSESLAPAVAAALGATQSGGRLVWQVDLPEAIHHDPDAQLAVMFADWDVRRGRTHVDYSGEEVRIEVFAGRSMVFSGHWQTMIEVDGQEQQPSGGWTDACQYSDDEVHYLEIEQPWNGGILLQRQMMLLRDDRCLLLADAILPSDRLESDSRSIKYVSRLPLSPSIEIDPEPETREIFLSDRRRRGLVIPLSAAEWRVGATNAMLKETEDGHLMLSTQGRGRLYAPLWFDFQQRRFKRKRTWRQLTIADQLRIVRRDEAVAYRVQVGSEQWMLYRSLSDRCCRSVLGLHLIADYFASRFDPGDGSHDELLTVDDNDSFDG
jgi:hypothetical protein